VIRLELETSLRQRRFAGIGLLAQAGQLHDGQIVDDVDARLTEAIEISRRLKASGSAANAFNAARRSIPGRSRWLVLN
jgi:hypothetical protein